MALPTGSADSARGTPSAPTCSNSQAIWLHARLGSPSTPRDRRGSPLKGHRSCLVDGAQRTLLASSLHLPPSMVPLVSDFCFLRSAQRLARLTL
jgi:hypothetical protein